MNKRTPTLATILAIIASVTWGTIILTAGPPAAADHIVEPTRPIVALDVNVYPYPQVTDGITDCLSGTEEYKGTDFARVEPILTIEPDWPDRAAPSEHYTVIYEISTTVHVVQRNGTVNTRLMKRSGGFWQHQNRPPHAFNPSEVVQWNEWQIPNGPVRIDWEFRGLESGTVLKASCEFVVVDSPVRDVFIDR